MTKFVGGVLGVGDLGADFFVIFPPGSPLTFFGLVLWNVGWHSRSDERALTYAVDDCPRGGGMDVRVRTRLMFGFTHLQRAQLFVSFLAITLSQKEHWIGMVCELKERGCGRLSGRSWVHFERQVHRDGLVITSSQSDVADPLMKVGVI